LPCPSHAREKWSENINFLGQYSFALSETVAQGQLRPLRDPEEKYAEAALA